MDVSTTDWYYDIICIAQGAGYVKGYDDGNIQPESKITRKEVAGYIC